MRSASAPRLVPEGDPVSTKPKVIGVDVGGTFTDLIELDEQTGAVAVTKVPSTPDNQAFGVMAAIERVEQDLGRVRAVVHGTTVTTNAVLERKYVACGIITTRGYRDVLEMGRRTRPESYGMAFRVTPLIPRPMRLEVAERMSARGEVVTQLDEAAVEAAVRELIGKGAEALVIHFLHSYANPAHERRAAEIARRLWPNPYVTISSDILTEFREFERAVTATLSAAVQPILERYIGRLQSELKGKGYESDLLVMQGNGGLVSSRIIVEHSVHSILSGPASGVSAAAYIAKSAQASHLVTCDMGGTSCDISVVQGGVPEVTSEKQLGFGMPIHVPMVDVHTIGAGGGSIARIDEGGLLRVGPESAGAQPGPICYGRGGTSVTLTDCNLVLGRLNGDRLLAVDRPVPRATVESAIEQDIGNALRLSATEAAAAAIRIADDRMAGAIRMVTLARGYDPRDFSLFAFGGAGPLHAVALARELGVPRVMVPLRPGIINALGCLVADVRHDFVHAVNRLIADLGPDDLHDALESHIARGHDVLARERIEIASIVFSHRAHMKFDGQTHVITVAVPTPGMTPAELASAFAQAYWNRFAVELPEMRPVLVELQTTVLAQRTAVKLQDLFRLSAANGKAARPAGARKVWFAGSGWAPTAIFEREHLPPGARFEGPAIVEQMDATTVIEVGNTVTVDALGNMLITLH
jgi:N-methylhydantoinase A